MKPKTGGFSPKNALFSALFIQKNANFPNRNLHSARLPPVSRAHTCFTATRDPEIGGRGPNPAYETQNQADLPQKCTFLGHFSSKNHKFSNQKSAFHQFARNFRGQHLLDHDRGPQNRGVGSHSYPLNPKQADFPPKMHFFRHFSSEKRKFSNQTSAFRPSAPGLKGSHLLHCHRVP